MKRLLSFPPICSKYCITYSHLLSLHYTPLELCRLCHKCIAWDRSPRPDTAPPSPQLKFSITDTLDTP